MEHSEEFILISSAFTSHEFIPLFSSLLIFFRFTHFPLSFLSPCPVVLLSTLAVIFYPVFLCPAVSSPAMPILRFQLPVSPGDLWPHNGTVLWLILLARQPISSGTIRNCAANFLAICTAYRGFAVMFHSHRRT